MGDGVPAPGAPGFLPAGRTPRAALAEEIERAAASPVVTALLAAQGGAAVVLDACRLIVAVNAGYLRLLGVDDPHAALGLRPGEALDCVHASEGADGCGTGPACASCGQAIALSLASLDAIGVERTCCLQTRSPAGEVDREFRVRATPLSLGPERFTLVALTDQTEAAQRALVDRIFLHDLANLALGLASASHELDEVERAEAVHDVQLLSEQLVREVRLQRALTSHPPGRIEPTLERVAVEAALDLARRAAGVHPAASGKALEVAPVDGEAVRTDPALLQHVLANMLVNALEATPPGGAVRLEARAEDGRIAFRVWNAGAIPPAIAPRIFQRFFSTKPGNGRGHGTFAMKLFGEQLLRGRVRFTTSEQDGTWFELSLPVAGPPAPAGGRSA